MSRDSFRDRPMSTLWEPRRTDAAPARTASPTRSRSTFRRSAIWSSACATVVPRRARTALTHADDRRCRCRAARRPRGAVVPLERAAARDVRVLRRPRRNLDRAVRAGATAPASALVQHSVRLTVPPGVADGARFRFRVTSPHAAPRARRGPGRSRSRRETVRLWRTSVRSSIRTSSSLESQIDLRIEFLGVLFIVWGVLTMLIGLVHARARRRRGRARRSARPEAASQLRRQPHGRAFTTLAVIALIWGAAHVAVGMPLRRHRHWSRLGGAHAGHASICCCCRTARALGGYALWALLREDARKLVQN